MGPAPPKPVDVVVVSYNSRERLRACVGPLSAVPGVRVIVADNASADASLEVIADLPVTRLALPLNGGFSYGCNAGVRAGHAPYVLFLNPDARIDPSSLARLVVVLETDPGLAAAGPRILDDDGSLHRSQRRFPRIASTLAVALFLHRLLRSAGWADELVHDEAAYERPGSPDWLSGACLLVRRRALSEVGGMDEGFFLYCEDTDLCRRLRDRGYDVRYEPQAVCAHQGGASAPRPRLLAVHAASRIRYARKHGGRTAALAERVGIGLAALLRMPISGPAARRGQARALRVAAGLGRP